MGNVQPFCSDCSGDGYFKIGILPHPCGQLCTLNSLASGKSEWNFRSLIFQIISVVDGWGISCELTLRWMSLGLTDDKSTLVQVMAWCRQATSHYLSQCWPRSLSPYGVIGPHWVAYFWKCVQQYVMQYQHIMNNSILEQSNPTLVDALLGYLASAGWISTTFFGNGKQQPLGRIKKSYKEASAALGMYRNPLFVQYLLDDQNAKCKRSPLWYLQKHAC